MKSVELKAFQRETRGRSALHRLRNSGRIPATIYGVKSQPQNLEVVWKELQEIIQHSASENLLVDLHVDQDTRPQRLVLLQDVQHHPLTGRVLHVDLHEVAADEKVTITIPIETAGTPIGVTQDGGVLEHVLFKVKVRALPRDLPEVIEVDVTELALGSSIHIADIKAPEGVVILGDAKIPVVAVALPRTEAQETAELEGAAPAAGPEMIKEKKVEKPEKGEKAEG